MCLADDGEIRSSIPIQFTYMTFPRFSNSIELDESIDKLGIRINVCFPFPATLYVRIIGKNISIINMIRIFRIIYIIAKYFSASVLYSSALCK